MMKVPVIALVSSVPEEGMLIVRKLKKKAVLAGKPLYGGRMHGKNVAYMISGIGKTNAAHAATFIAERFYPDLFILFGIGGAYPSSGLGVGDIAVAQKEVYGDEGVLTGDGFHGAESIGIPLLKRGRRKYFNEFPLDKRLFGKTVRALKRQIPPHPPLEKGGRGDFMVKKGGFVTVSTCTGTRKRASELQKRFGAVCENMEGAAVAHVCTSYGIPVIEIRGISNIVGDRDRARWDIRQAAENCQRVLMELLKKL